MEFNVHFADIKIINNKLELLKNFTEMITLANRNKKEMCLFRLISFKLKKIYKTTTTIFRRICTRMKASKYVRRCVASRQSKAKRRTTTKLHEKSHRYIDFQSHSTRWDGNAKIFIFSDLFRVLCLTWCRQPVLKRKSHFKMRFKFCAITTKNARCIKTQLITHISWYLHLTN